MADTDTTIETAVDLSVVQPGDIITRDGQRYNVIEPSQVAAQALPKKATAKTYLLKLTCGCKNGTIRATATAALKRGNREDETFAALPAELQTTGWFCYLCNQPVVLASSTSTDSTEEL